MSDFPRRSTLPMQPSSFRAAARKIRRMADQLEVSAEAETPRERATRTRTIHRLAQYTRHLSQRNRK